MKRIWEAARLATVVILLCFVLGVIAGTVLASIFYLLVRMPLVAAVLFGTWLILFFSALIFHE